MNDEEKYKKALELLNQLIELFPDNGHYYFNRGNAYKNLKKYVVRLSDNKIYHSTKDCAKDNNISERKMYKIIKSHDGFIRYHEWITTHDTN